MIKIEQTQNEYPFFSADVFGDFQIEVLEQIQAEQSLKLEVKGLTKNPFEVIVNVEDVGGNMESPDLGDLFRFLMELLKNTVCPHCL